MKKVVACVVLSALIFSTMEVALKIGGAGLDSIQLTFLRFFIGALVLVPPAILECRKSGYKANLKDLAWMAATGVMGVSISMLSFQIGVMHLNASTAAPVVCTNSMFAMLVAHIFTSEKMSKRKWIAFILGLIAIFFMIRPWDMQEGNSVLGFSTLILAAITFGAYTVMGKQTIERIAHPRNDVHVAGRLIHHRHRRKPEAQDVSRQRTAAEQVFRLPEGIGLGTMLRHARLATKPGEQLVDVVVEKIPMVELLQRQHLRVGHPHVGQTEQRAHRCVQRCCNNLVGCLRAGRQNTLAA